MTRRLPFALAASVLLALPSPAAAAKKKPATKAPVVTKVSPKSAKVGQTLTITGKNFVRGKGKNLVFFYTAKGGGTFTKAGDASKTRLKVTVPGKLAALLPANGNEARILLRVKGKRLGGRSTARVSPLISINPDDVGGDSGGGASGPTACTPNFTDPTSDVDKDLLKDFREREFMLDACNRDTDGDGVPDGYEYFSARDLNSRALPYPFKTPYPNALFKDDQVDYDGDGLYLADEYALWTKDGQSQIPLNYSDESQIRLNYSDGNQMSNPAEGVTDDYRDADVDGLGNWDESHGHMTPEWWKAKYDGTNGPLETPYPVTFGPVSMLDDDSDGDKVKDGDDDSDFDGLSNSFEVHRPANWDKTYIATGNVAKNWDGSAPRTDNPGYPPRYYSRVQPFNPCKPVWSKTCHIHYPFGYYALDEPWMPPTVFPPAPANPGDA